ncbi:hydroxyproline-rich glycoprotein [Striga asiatica]|uniref:Hydroxyproline-rich glycoprotein n=1 Tax=Striga asiatica TaxID=4170 RepID=A0A5A7P209_STRAF|nr:hydroxyproline-rich glycoprotein [Striga asiatica]
MAYSILNTTPSLVTIFTSFIAFFSISFASGELSLPASTISAAPAISPDFISPASSPPALSPDIFPLFPTPSGPALSPGDSSLPLIPSSLSPPNPDPMEAHGPVTVFGPSQEYGLTQGSFSNRVDLSLVVFVFGGVLVNAAL